MTERNGLIMEIAIIADDNKKELMTQFCIAYCGSLARHHLCATSVTGKYITEATGLEIEQLLGGLEGGGEQISARISCNEIDLLFYFRSTEPRFDEGESEAERTLLRLCDVYNVPVATNIATAEVLVTALEAGSFDWREFINPRSAYNRRKKAVR